MAGCQLVKELLPIREQLIEVGVTLKVALAVIALLFEGVIPPTYKLKR